MSEYEKANKLVEQFLGIKWGHLCPQFGFNHNTQQLLLVEVFTSFLAFHGLLYLSRCVSSKVQEQDGQAKQQSREQDASLQELENLSSMVDRTLGTMTQMESRTSPSASQQQASALSVLESGSPRSKRDKPQDLERLREEFQGKIAAVKNKWQTVPEEPRQPLLVSGPDDLDEFHVAAAAVVLYWALQAILCCVVMSSIGLSMLRIADGGVWPHYCLLIYASSNSGMLPTACLAIIFLADWFLFEGITTLPVHDLAPFDPPYLPVGPGEELPPEVQRPVPQRSRQELREEMRRHKADVADLKSKFILLCLPEFVPLLFMVLTHAIPFLFMFLWLSVIMLIGIFLVIALVRFLVKQLTSDPRARILRQTQVLMFLVYLFVTLYVHTSVQVMTRVYAGEWRHGGFFDSLWWHLIIDADKLASCPWISVIRWVDLPLRWT